MPHADSGPLLRDFLPRVTMNVLQVYCLPQYLTKAFPVTLLVCNVGAAICYAVAGDYKRSVYWVASALCVGAVTF